MTSLRFLFLLFFGPHLSSLVDICTATILLLPTKRRLGEQASKYHERTSGSCTDVAGFSLIGTSEDCEEGAGVLGWSDTSATTVSHDGNTNDVHPYHPRGCFFATTATSLYFNTKTSSTTACSSTLKCICKLTCPAGTYQDQTGQTTCKPCEAGKFSPFGKSTCEYEATTCPKGTFASGTAACTSCIAGKYNDAIGKTAETDCKTCLGSTTADQSDCLQKNVYAERSSGFCTDGDGSYIGTKEDCSEGAGVLGFSDTTVKIVSDSRYPRGCLDFYGIKGEGYLFFNTDTSTTACGPGQPCLCKLICQAGTYQDQTGQSACKPCEAGKFSPFGKSTCEYEATTCPKGTYASGTAACTSCAAGKYNDVIGKTAETDCKSCPNGGYHDLIGQISDSNCKTCESGKEPTGDQKACVIIGEQPVTYFYLHKESCNQVLNGKRTDEKAPTFGEKYLKGGSYIGTKEECEEAAGVLGWSDTTADTVSYDSGGLNGEPIVGSHGCYEDSDGNLKFNTDTSSMGGCTSGFSYKCLCKLTCQAGTYQDQTGQTTCNSCETGQYQNQVEQSSCKDDCGAGSYITADKGDCSVCNSGQYQNEDGQSSCKPVTTPTTTTTTAAVATLAPAPTRSSLGTESSATMIQIATTSAVIFFIATAATMF